MSSTSVPFQQLAESVKNPSAEWRSAPFWALNGELDPEEIRKQIRGFHQNGLGGFYLHARTGLKTAYLSEKWFECIDAAVDEAKKLNMEAWLYDEDRFPSGSGGGLITCDPEYRAKGITLKEVPFADAASEELPETTLAVFAAKVSGVHAENVRRLNTETFRGDLQEGETLLVFYTDTVNCSTWYNDYTYLDTLSVKAVRKFIELTHEAYAKRYSKEFGNVIPGIFTDEPRYGFLIDQPEWDTEHRKMLPWTEGLLEDFRETYHYDALDRCPEFFYEVAGADSVAPRVHYVSTMLKFFKKAFWEPINTWCKEHHLKLTGHPVGEDSLSYQTLGIGSAMQLYEHMGMPGIDLLSEHHRAYQTAKQLSSAARQFGKKRRLVEVYGCTGWYFSPAGIKALGDWLYALGVNYRCEHLALYSIEGEAKRDYPCPVALQTNFPETYRNLNNYFARLSACLSEGKEDRRILFVSAQESAWSMFHQEWRKEKKTLDFDRGYVKLSNLLLAHQLDFDYGDEGILAQLANVKGDTLTVGEAEYKVVVLPHLITIRSSTLNLLKEFQANGGLVLSAGEIPGYIDAVKQEMVWPFPQVKDPAELVKLLQGHVPCRIADPEGKTCRSLLHQVRRGKDWDSLYLCNTGHPVDEGNEEGEGFVEPNVMFRKEIYPEVQISFESPYSGELVEFDPFTGKYLAADAEYRDGKWIIRSGFQRLATKLFFALPAKGMVSAEQPEPELKEWSVAQTIAPEQWEIELSEPNVAVMDHFKAAEDSEPEYVLFLDDKLRENLGIEVRNFMMPQPWCRKIDKISGGEVSIFFDFECESLPQENIALVLERPELYQITLNGKPVEKKDLGEWHASAWRKVELPKEYLIHGKNRFVFTTRLTNAHPGLESMFLTGNFGVKADGMSFILTAPVKTLKLGSWCEQGLPFYPGAVIYKTKVRCADSARGAIRLPDYNGTPAEIRIDQKTVSALIFSPGTTGNLDLPREFDLEIAVTGSMRNSCGPFFRKELYPVSDHPIGYKLMESETRQLLPYGLNSAPEILTEKENK